MHGQGKNSSFFQYSYYLPAKLQRNNDTTKYYRLFFIVPLPLAPCSLPHALSLNRESRRGSSCPSLLAPCSLPKQGEPERVFSPLAPSFFPPLRGDKRGAGGVRVGFLFDFFSIVRQMCRFAFRKLCFCALKGMLLECKRAPFELRLLSSLTLQRYNNVFIA